MKFIKEYFTFIKAFLNDVKLKFIILILNELFKRTTLIIIPIITQIIIDGAIYKNKSLQDFYICSIGLLLITLLSVFFNTIDYTLKNKIKVCIINAIKIKVISNMMHTDEEKQPLGAIYERINNDTDQVASFLINDIIKFIFNAIYVIVVVVLMIRMNIVLSLLILFLFPLTILINLVYSPILSKYNKLKKKNSDDFNSHVETVYSADLIIKSYNIISFIKKRTAYILNKYKESVYREIKVVAFFDFFLLNFILNLGTILPSTIGVYFVYRNLLTIGEVTAFSLFCSRLWTPIEFFMDFPALLIDRKNSFYRLLELFYKDLDDKDIKELKLNSLSFKNLQIEGLGYTINNSKIFDNINLLVNQGDRIAIIGRNGSGKTTIGRMLIKLKQPTDGKILYNDIPINDISSPLLREKIIYIPPRAFIFAYSLEENIYFDKQRNTINIQDFELLKEIQEKHQKAPILTNCSEGEKKIIEIFRALNKDADLYIFDEPLAYLDKENKEKIINLIMEFMKDKTVIFITHEKELIKKCAKVLEL